MISRRALLAAALASTVASTVAACGSKHDLTSSASLVATPQPTLPTATLPPGAKVPASLVMIGDSITVASRKTLEPILTAIGFSSVAINAQVNRRIEVGSGKNGPTPGIVVADFVRASGKRPDVWVVALGTNDAGLYSTDAEYRDLIDTMLARIPPQAPLVWIDTYRRDQLTGAEQFNGVLRKAISTRGHAVMGEWYQQVTKSKGKILRVDGVHPNAAGVLVFSDLVRNAIVTVLS